MISASDLFPDPIKVVGHIGRRNVSETHTSRNDRNESQQHSTEEKDENEDEPDPTAPTTPDAFAHIQLTNTGAEQIVGAIGDANAASSKAHRQRQQGERLLHTYASEASGMYVARMKDTDQDTGKPILSLRIQHEEESTTFILAPKKDCLLVLGARQEEAPEHVYEKEVQLRLLVGTNGTPPISESLWEDILALDTRDEHHQEVEQRLKQWRAYLYVQKKQAEEQQFELDYESVRHLDTLGRIRLDLPNRSRHEHADRLSSARGERISLYTENPEGNSGRAVAQAEIIGYKASQHSLTIELSEEDTDNLERDYLHIPPEGWIQHKAFGTLSMVWRQERAIETLKQTGGAMQNLDLFLFGSDEEIDPPPLDPVAPIPESECLDPEHTNEKQRLAVAQALDCPDMFFLQGPPGTGKTTFIAELCYQLGRRGKRALVASQANLAVDNALGRLQESRDILAVRVAREDKVDAEGKPFIGEQAVRTWLRGVADHASQRITDQKHRQKAYTIAQQNEKVLKSWAQQTSQHEKQIQELHTKKATLKDKLETTQEEAEHTRKLHAAVEDTIDRLFPIWDEMSETPDMSSPSPTQQTAWSSLPSPVLEHWSDATRTLRATLTEYAPDRPDLETPWEVYQALCRYEERLHPGGELAAKIQAAQRISQETAPLQERVRAILTSIQHAQQRVDDAETRARAQKDAFERISSIDRTTDPDRIDGDHFPVWHASASRVKRARALHAGRHSSDGALPDQSARELVHTWKDAEIGGRSDGARMLLENLSIALTNMRKRAQAPRVGRLYKRRIPPVLDQLDDAIEDVQASIRGHADSPLATSIRDEIRSRERSLKRAYNTARDRVRTCKRALQQTREKIDRVRDEVTQHTDQIIDRFASLLDDTDRAGATVAHRFLNLIDALSHLESRLGERRQWVGQQKDRLKQSTDHVKTRLRDTSDQHRRNARKAAAKVERYEKSISDTASQLQQLHQRHTEARKVWQELCTLDPDLPDEALLEHPSVSWIDDYISVSADVDEDRIRKEQEIISDWKEAITSEDGPISGGLKDRFYRNANVVGVTCARAGKRDFRSEYGVFDTVIVDEVSKATPTELLMPALLGKNVALVGDHRQLAPVFGREGNFEAAADQLGIETDDLKENLQRSLFKERFEYFADQEREAAPDQQLADNEYPGRRTLMLTTQYRMHSQIMEGINQFYDEQLELGQLKEDGELHPLDVFRHHNLNIEPWIRPNRHLVWVDTPVGHEWQHTQDGSTRYNQKEMETTIHMLKELAEQYRQNEAFNLSIGVTSVYASQVQHLRRHIQKMDLPQRMRDGLRISTVDRFQGMERDIMFLNLVLNRKNHPPSKWLRTPERINVAMSRARRLLVIVGSKHNYVDVDNTSPAYSRFFDVARKYGHYVKASLIGIQ